MKKIYFIIFVLVASLGFAGVGGHIGGSGGSSSSIKFGKRLITLQDFDETLQHIVHWPDVVFEKIPTPIKNVCADGEILKTINPIKVCTKMVIDQVCARRDHGSEECHNYRSDENVKESSNVRFIMKCGSTIEQKFETSKFYEAPVCVKWIQINNGKNLRNSCAVYGTETKEYPMNYKISVTRSGRDSQGDVEVANLPFEIPECQKEQN